MAVTAVAAANNEREVLDFDLQFEDNEVLDIWSIEHKLSLGIATITADTDLDFLLGVFEDPDKAVATDLSLEATFEDDSSLIWFDKNSLHREFVTAAAISDMLSSFSNYFVFPQPYTVARNIAIILQMDGTEGDAIDPVSHVTVWGRRRNASDAEFKNIIYRQRF